MMTAIRKRGLTLIEVLVLLAILVGLIALVVPAIQAAREASRRATCVNNLTQLGIGLQNYVEARKKFPAAGDYNTSRGRWGWSWLTKVRPYMTSDTLWDSLQITVPANADPEAPGGTGQTIANLTSPGFLLCPSYLGPRWTTLGPPAGGPIANYKAIGATSKASLAVGDPVAPAPPPYGTAADHPDGTLFYKRELTLSDISDGPSNTLIACETVEEGSTAWWYLGRYATLVGLPTTMQPPGAAPLNFAYPAGFTYGKYADESTVTDKTYLTADWDKTPYDAANGIKYGPSSRHPGVVNHLYVDGRVRSIPLDVDVAFYSFQITRRACDPGEESSGCPVKDHIDPREQPP